MRDTMDRIDKILKHDLFLYHLQRNNSAEAQRRFCRHNISHFLDVARIAEIINLEERLQIPRDLIYGAALLHDIGKHIQYETGTPHEIASGEIAPFILRECGFDDNETDVIIDAILHHRDSQTAGRPNLQGVLYRADKASRACFACEASADCNWKEGRKNLQIKY